MLLLWFKKRDLHGDIVRENGLLNELELLKSIGLEDLLGGCVRDRVG